MLGRMNRWGSPLMIAVGLVASVWSLVGVAPSDWSQSSRARSLEDMRALRGQGICAQCEAVATTACPAVGNPCAGLVCVATRWSAADGITICTGAQYNCTIAALRKGCQAAFSWWCNGNSAGMPCGASDDGVCVLGLVGCRCRRTVGGAGSCPYKNCT